MALKRVALLSCLSFLVSIISFSSMASSEQEWCNYIVRVKTGDRADAGTDSTISLKLMYSSSLWFTVNNLEEWGIMEPGRDYFERNNFDIFSGNGPCLDPCAITVTSDGKGNKPGWYLNYVETTVIMDGGVSITQYFQVDQWLALDESPHQLHADVNLCKPTLSSV